MGVTLEPRGEVCEFVPLCQVSEVFASFIPFSRGVAVGVVPWYTDNNTLPWCLSVLQLVHPLDVVEPILVKLRACRVLRVALMVCQ